MAQLPSRIAGQHRPLLTRRALLIGGLAAPAVLTFPGFAQAQLAHEPLVASASPLQRAIDAAALARGVFRLPPGITRTAGLLLPDGARLVGAPGGSELVLTGKGPLLRAAHGGRVTLSGISFNGGGIRYGEAVGLLDFRDIAELVLEGCTLRRSGGTALRLERCGGAIRHCRIEDAGRAALFSLDAVGLSIKDNAISRCADNGIQIWRSEQGHDGTLLKANRITAIRNVSGGSGQYGNAISVFRAGGVNASGNSIADCAFSALRNNSGHDVSFIGNDCKSCGETAIFAEFAFRNAIIRNNRIDGALSGIQMVNFADAGGRGALCTGNILKNLPSQKPDGEGWGYGAAIKAEADALVAGNVIEGAPWIGVMAGWGPSLDNVRVEDNTIANAPIGVGVSVAPGAGRASVRGNRISGARDGAIAAMRWTEVVNAGLAEGAGSAYPQISVTGNAVR